MSKSKKINTPNQLININNYNAKKSMVFAKAKAGNSGQVTFFRVHTQTRYEDGSVGDLLIPCPELFTFGLQVNENQQTKQADGWNLPLCLYDRDGHTEEQKMFVDKLKEIVNNCRDHLLEFKDSVEKPNLNEHQIPDEEFSFIKYKKEKGKIVQGSSPLIYCKMVESKSKTDPSDRKIMSVFYDSKGKPMNPLDTLGVRARVKPVLKIESIFVGAKIISLQVKLWEVKYNPVSSAPVALARPLESDDDDDVEYVPTPMLMVEKPVEVVKEIENSDSDEEEKVKEVKQPAKQPVNKTVQKKK